MIIKQSLLLYVQRSLECSGLHIAKEKKAAKNEVEGHYSFIHESKSALQCPRVNSLDIMPT